MVAELAEKRSPRRGAEPHYGEEVDQFHTRLLRTSLAVEESRAYWERWRAGIPREQLAVIAFEERWFGNKSLSRVRQLVSEFGHRYDAYPVAFSLLLWWQPKDPVTRQNICHWHLQLTDPLYRAFTADFLEQRRTQGNLTVDRDVTVRWLNQHLKREWASATAFRMATGLVGASSAAGLTTENPGSRQLKYPKVTDEALGYWLHFLRHLSIKGTLLANAYFASVGLSEGFLEQRLRRLPELSFGRMGDLYDFGWHHEDLWSWAAQVLGVRVETTDGGTTV